MCREGGKVEFGLSSARSMAVLSVPPPRKEGGIWSVLGWNSVELTPGEHLPPPLADRGRRPRGRRARARSLSRPHQLKLSTVFRKDLSTPALTSIYSLRSGSGRDRSRRKSSPYRYTSPSEDGTCYSPGCLIAYYQLTKKQRAARSPVGRR